jgi:hypothetical protein
VIVAIHTRLAIPMGDALSEVGGAIMDVIVAEINCFSVPTQILRVVLKEDDSRNRCS